MLSKKERILWILAILIAVVFTFLMTSDLTTITQKVNVEVSSTKEYTDIEKEADHWFTSSDSPMPRRDFYTEIKNSGPTLIYQGALERKEPWISYPEQIALRSFFPPSEIEGFVPTQVSIYFYNTDIESVLIKVISRAGLGATENRLDFIKADNVWKILWAGQRSIMLE